MSEHEDARDKISSPAQEREWIGEAYITYGGLIGLGLVMIQPFIYRGQFTGLAAKIAVSQSL